MTWGDFINLSKNLNEDFLNKRLEKREEQELLRKLSTQNNLVDFSSNDYLGFARSSELKRNTSAELEKLNLHPEVKLGSTGSRLLTGNSLYAEELEKFIAGYHTAEAGLIFNSGYDANLGLISSVAGKEDVIFYDELSHASIYDGVRLSKAESFPFRHNDVTHLEERLKYFSINKKNNSVCFVIVESIYSMDGDFAPLKEITALCNAYDANLIVDEAHATGIFGKKGEGRVSELGFEQKVFARVHTFGKALGCHGAIVLGSDWLRNYLINFARSFIYTTALPVHSLANIKQAYNHLNLNHDITFKISRLVTLLRSIIYDNSIAGYIESSSPIQSIIIEGNNAVKNMALLVQKEGFDVRPIMSPTVPKGKERIRICLHAFNTEEEVKGLLMSVKNNRELVLKKQMA